MGREAGGGGNDLVGKEEVGGKRVREGDCGGGLGGHYYNAGKWTLLLVVI